MNQKKEIVPSYDITIISNKNQKFPNLFSQTIANYKPMLKNKINPLEANSKLEKEKINTKTK